MIEERKVSQPLPHMADLQDDEICAFCAFLFPVSTIGGFCLEHRARVVLEAAACDRFMDKCAALHG